ncbi:MAG: glycyl-radical enzyme activating protein [Dehalococcoidia bacterium]
MAEEKPGSGSLDQYSSDHGQELKAWIFDIQRYSINDGPGIRTTVFFKGCPLRCLWCDNPESQSRLPQLFYFKSLCARCHRCISVCPNEAISVGPDDEVITDRSKCKACGACTVVCPKEARVITGKLMTLDEVLNIIKQDTPFYRNSGGGMTASGGEAAAQPEFLIELLKRCRENGIHTTLDTTGYVPPETMERILEHTDLVLMDIKHLDPVRHEEITGVSNDIILQNARKIAEIGKPMWIRFPLIPGCTDSDGNVDATADFVLSLKLNRIDILPYHRMGMGKYERLGMEYPLAEVPPYPEEQQEKVRTRLESKGLEVRVA